MSEGGVEGGVEGHLSRFHISEVTNRAPGRGEERQDTLTEDTVDGAGMSLPSSSPVEHEHDEVSGG